MTEPLDEQEIEDALADLDGWEYAEDEITKTYEFNDFEEAMAFVNTAAQTAEEHAHHPDIHISYNTVTLSVSTHSAGHKVTEKDLALARAVDVK